MDDQRTLDDEAQQEISSRGSINKSLEDLADHLTTINVRQLVTSAEYKRGRMNKIKKFEELYQGKVPRKFRQLFSIPFPVFTGFVDTLESDFSDPITCLFKEEDPSDYFAVKKIQAAFDTERKSMTPAAMWDMKVRLDKKNAIMSGRGILKYYASSDPEYQSHFDVVDYNFFHCQPNGGAHLENHLFAGEEAIRKTRSELIQGARDGIYNKEQVKKLLAAASAKEYEDMHVSDSESVLAKFRALNLDPQSHSYLGEQTFNLVQFCSVYKGRRFYNLFDPFTKIWIRFDELKNVYSGEYYPWMSWATHEDQRVFWSVGYSDFFYPISDGMITLINQEMTNREKSNFNARAYDESMFEDEAKLDEAQYRPDALVPVNTRNGARKIQDGIYRFDTPQLQGTINLVEWLHNQSGTMGGAPFANQGGAPKPGTKAYVQFQQQQQIAKRLGYKAQSYQECYQQVGLRFIQGLKDHMPSRMAVRMVGPEGYDHWDEVTRLELNLKKTPHIEIQSTTAQENANKMKTDKRIQALTTVKDLGTVNPKVLTEFTLRYVGEFDDMDIALLMDLNTSVDKETQAKAAIAIKSLVEGKEPAKNYSADVVYMKLIRQFMVDHMEMLKKRHLIDKFLKHLKEVSPIAQKNMQALAEQIKVEKQFSAIKAGVDTSAPQKNGPPQNEAPKPPMNTASPIRPPQPS